MTTIDKNPLDSWRGEFGADYIGRNQVTDAAAREATTVFGRLFETCGIRAEVHSLLEVGANVGINLTGLRRVLGPEVELSAAEPNPAACAALRGSAALALTAVLETDAYRIPVPDNTYDFVFTNGVLIHIPPYMLPTAMREICRVARRYVLCSEYFSDTPCEVPYHGQTGLLWKRDFGALYLDTCPELAARDYGFLWRREFPHFDNLNWWLFEKTTLEQGPTE